MYIYIYVINHIYIYIHYISMTSWKNSSIFWRTPLILYGFVPYSVGYPKITILMGKLMIDYGVWYQNLRHTNNYPPVNSMAMMHLWLEARYIIHHQHNSGRFSIALLSLFLCQWNTNTSASSSWLEMLMSLPSPLMSHWQVISCPWFALKAFWFSNLGIHYPWLYLNVLVYILISLSIS